MTYVGDLIKIFKGCKADEVFDVRVDGALPYIQIDDLRPDATSKYALCKKGLIAKETDILIAWDGANAGTVNYGLKGYIGSTIAILRPTNKEVYTPYLGRFLQSKFKYLRGKCTGATIPHIDREVLENIPVNIPSLAEQKRIVSILDKADRIRQLRKYTLKLTDSFLQSVFLEMFGDLANKNKFDFTSLGDVSEIASGVTKGQKFNDKKTHSVPYLRVANVQDGYLDLSEIKMIESLPQDSETLKLKYGDVLMTEGGDYDKLGRGCIWKNEIDNCIHQNHIFRVRLNKKFLLPEIFSILIRLRYSKDYFIKCSKQTTNLATINMTQLKDFQVPQLPYEVQEKFTKVLSRFQSLTKKLEESERQSEMLFQSLLHKAFSGELSEKDEKVLIGV